MAFKNSKVEEVAVELEKLGIITPQKRLRLESIERVDMDVPFTVAGILAQLDPYEMQNTQWVALEKMAPELGIQSQVAARKASFTEGERAGMVTPASMGAELAAGVESFKTGWNWLSKKWNEATGQGDRPDGSYVRDLITSLEENGYDVPAPTLQSQPNMDRLMAYLNEEFDLSPRMLDEIMERTNDKQAARIVADGAVDDALEADEELNRINESNPEWAKNYKAYIKMERLTPGKYQFDIQSGAIWSREDGSIVDRQGRQIGTEEGMREILGLDAEAELPAQRILNDLAENPDKYEVPWARMGIDESSYYDILDVVNNKSGYGAIPTRYVPGMPGFLGGFDSTYRVTPQDDDRTKSMRDLIAGGTPDQVFTDPGYFNDLKNRVLQETRRPWYNEDDNWARFAGLSPESIAEVQRTLVDWGALAEDEVVFGNWGPAEADVMNTVMTVANGKAVQWTDASIAELMPSLFAEQAAATGRRAAFVPEAYRPMDPATVELSVKESVRQMLGRDPTSDDLASLGSYMTDMYSSSYAADVEAARNVYAAQVAADESEAQYGTAGAVEDVDWESRFILEMENRFAPQLESQKRGKLAGEQQDVGKAMSNLMAQLGGGIG